MTPTPKPIHQYHVFLASPGDVAAERQHVRKFFDEFNRSTAHLWGARFEVVDWENYATVGVGRPQELITRQTLEKFRDSLVLVIGIMNQRFGSPTGKAESGTEEEFNWAMESHKASGFPEIKWFFRKRDTLDVPAEPTKLQEAVDQWLKVRAFRQRMQDLNDPLFYGEYPDSAGFATVFDRDLRQWLTDSSRPWIMTAAVAPGGVARVELPPEFNAATYQAALRKQFGKLKFDVLDTSGALYSGVQLWSVFVPQSVRECHEYNPRLLEIPKEHQLRLVGTGAIAEKELAEAEKEAEELRKRYFQQPLRPVLDVVDEALSAAPAASPRRLVLLGDPGSGKSSLIRYQALRWAEIDEPARRDAERIPVVIELNAYSRWSCDGRKDFIRFLEESQSAHEWPRGLLHRLIEKTGKVALLLDGLDEVFDGPTRELVVNDILRFSGQFPDLPIVLTSRVVGYQAQRLREADFRHFMLQDLDHEQITEFVERWHEVTFEKSAPEATLKRDRLQKAIRESKAIAMLAGNPLLLTMMAILNRNQELPRDRSELYAQASRVLLHQWDTERALAQFPGLSTEIGLREKNEILRRVATHLLATPGGLKGNLIAGQKLTDLIESYLKKELHFTQARAAARAVVDHLRERNFILCFVGADSYAFVHRTFLEYYCAVDLVHEFNVAKTLNEVGLMKLFERHCRDEEWREVLRLLCGQIDEGFVGRVVERLASLTDLANWDGETPLPELPLAIQCLSEVRGVRQLEAAGATLLRQVITVAAKVGSRPEVWPFLFQALLPACKELGERWPGRQLLRSVAISQVQEFRVTGHGRHFWPHLVAQVLGDREVAVDLALRTSGSRGDAIRGAALQALADKWPDPDTRELIARRAVEDDNSGPRSAALRALADKWPDPDTRELIARRAVEDDHFDNRRVALQALADKWPDPDTRELLARRMLEAPDPDERGAACSGLGRMHSELGRILPTRDLDGEWPFLDPLAPISRNHIERAAAKLGLPAAEIDARIASLSAHLGFDVTVGAKNKKSGKST